MVLLQVTHEEARRVRSWPSVRYSDIIDRGLCFCNNVWKKKNEGNVVIGSKNGTNMDSKDAPMSYLSSSMAKYLAWVYMQVTLKKKVLLVDKYYVILCRGDKTKRFLTWPHMLWTFWRPRINDCEQEERLAPEVCDLPVGVCMYLIHVINEKANRKSNQASGHRTKDSHLALRVRGNQWRGNMTPVSAFQFQTKSHLCRQLCHKGVSVFCKKKVVYTEGFDACCWVGAVTIVVKYLIWTPFSRYARIKSWGCHSNKLLSNEPKASLFLCKMTRTV